MSTHINDLAPSVMVTTILPPQLLATSDPIGVAADCIEADGPCFALQLIGEVAGEAFLAGRIEESDDGETWVAISDGEFAATAEPGLALRRFFRKRRYLRWAALYDPQEGDSMTAAAIVLQARKTI